MNTDTPETDAAYSKNDMANAQTSGDLANKRHLLSCRLERERNQARQERDDLAMASTAILKAMPDLSEFENPQGESMRELVEKLQTLLEKLKAKGGRDE